MESRDLLEIREHGSTMFHLQVYEVVLTRGPKQQPVNLHWHAEIEFVLVTEGTVRIRVGTDWVDIEKGSAVMINGEELHSMIAPDDLPSECNAIVFDLSLLDSARYDLIQHQYIQPFVEKRYRFPRLVRPGSVWSDAVLHDLSRICDLSLTRPIAFEMRIKSHLYSILAELYQHNAYDGDRKTNKFQEDKFDRLKHVLTYIDEHLSDRLRLDELAAEAHMSEGHFCRFFREMTQQKPMRYINERRVQHATRMLEDPDRSITSIALDLGFQDVSYFIRVFRSFNHCTPLDYRKRLMQADVRANP